MITIGDIVFVLGMHRSGTSAITRLLKTLGADPGSNLLASDPELNKKGYWENLRLIDLHDAILDTMGSAWYDFRPYPDKWWLERDIRSFFPKTMEILEQDFKSHNLMLIKDPRISRLLPYWLGFLEQSGGSAKCVIVMRNPLEVAKSVGSRDQFSVVTSLYLWMVYTLESEYYSRGLPRTVVKYETTLNDSNSIVDQLTAELKIDWPINPDKVRKTIDSDLDTSLRHHQNPEKPEDILELVESAFALYEMITAHNPDQIRPYLDETRIRVYEDPSKSFPWAKSMFETNRALFETKKEYRKSQEKSLAGIIKRIRMKTVRTLTRN